jgi:hypothetical protein
MGQGLDSCTHDRILSCVAHLTSALLAPLYTLSQLSSQQLEEDRGISGLFHR